jgi:purine-binding chemotaxis protein CheW
VDAAHVTAETTQYLIFSLGGEDYAVRLPKVREIIRHDTAPTTVPAMPAWVSGVINLRGRVIPVIDLAMKFGVPGGPITKRTCVVVMDVSVNGEHSVIGVIADHVSDVTALSASDIEPPPSFGTTVRSDLLAGLGKVGSRFVLILDIDRVLATPLRA